ncbi:MAG: hypothetical protein HYS07_06685, partial [Chlamydiae bacterium]|nr:hypothetical protein [Chlamydiota bacterium]MBI3277843.1 hypothetical protein [Chlamydiota bacterium]
IAIIKEGGGASVKKGLIFNRSRMEEILRKEEIPDDFEQFFVNEGEFERRFEDPYGTLMTVLMPEVEGSKDSMSGMIPILTVALERLGIDRKWQAQIEEVMMVAGWIGMLGIGVVVLGPVFANVGYVRVTAGLVSVAFEGFHYFDFLIGPLARWVGGLPHIGNPLSEWLKGLQLRAPPSWKGIVRLAILHFASFWLLSPLIALLMDSFNLTGFTQLDIILSAVGAFGLILTSVYHHRMNLRYLNQSANLTDELGNKRFDPIHDLLHLIRMGGSNNFGDITGIYSRSNTQHLVGGRRFDFRKEVDRVRGVHDLDSVFPVLRDTDDLMEDLKLVPHSDMDEFKAAFPDFRTPRDEVNPEGEFGFVKRLAHGKNIQDVLVEVKNFYERRYPGSSLKSLLDVQKMTFHKIQKGNQILNPETRLPTPGGSYVDENKVLHIFLPENAEGELDSLSALAAFHEIYEVLIKPMDPTVPWPDEKNVCHTLVALAENGLLPNLIQRFKRQLDAASPEWILSFIREYESGEVLRQITEKFEQPEDQTRLSYAKDNAENLYKLAQDRLWQGIRRWAGEQNPVFESDDFEEYVFHLVRHPGTLRSALDAARTFRRMGQVNPNNLQALKDLFSSLNRMTNHWDHTFQALGLWVEANVVHAENLQETKDFFEMMDGRSLEVRFFPNFGETLESLIRAVLKNNLDRTAIQLKFLKNLVTRIRNYDHLHFALSALEGLVEAKVVDEQNSKTVERLLAGIARTTIPSNVFSSYKTLDMLARHGAVQRAYLDEMGDWIHKINKGAGQNALFVHHALQALSKADVVLGEESFSHIKRLLSSMMERVRGTSDDSLTPEEERVMHLPLSIHGEGSIFRENQDLNRELRELWQHTFLKILRVNDPRLKRVQAMIRSVKGIQMTLSREADAALNLKMNGDLLFINLNRFDFIDMILYPGLVIKSLLSSFEGSSFKDLSDDMKERMILRVYPMNIPFREERSALLKVAGTMMIEICGEWHAQTRNWDLQDQNIPHFLVDFSQGVSRLMEEGQSLPNIQNVSESDPLRSLQKYHLQFSRLQKMYALVQNCRSRHRAQYQVVYTGFEKWGSNVSQMKSILKDRILQHRQYKRDDPADRIQRLLDELQKGCQEIHNAIVQAELVSDEIAKRRYLKIAQDIDAMNAFMKGVLSSLSIFYTGMAMETLATTALTEIVYEGKYGKDDNRLYTEAAPGEEYGKPAWIALAAKLNIPWITKRLAKEGLDVKRLRKISWKDIAINLSASRLGMFLLSIFAPAIVFAAHSFVLLLVISAVWILINSALFAYLHLGKEKLQGKSWREKFKIILRDKRFKRALLWNAEFIPGVVAGVVGLSGFSTVVYLASSIIFLVSIYGFNQIIKHHHEWNVQILEKIKAAEKAQNTPLTEKLKKEEMATMVAGALSEGGRQKFLKENIEKAESFYFTLEEMDHGGGARDYQLMNIVLQNGLLTREEFERRKIVDKLFLGLMNLDSVIMQSSAESLKNIYERGWISEAELKSDLKVSEWVPLLKTHGNSEVRKNVAGVLLSLVRSGMMTKQDVIESELIPNLVDRIAHDNSVYVRKACAEVLKALKDKEEYNFELAQISKELLWPSIGFDLENSPFLNVHKINSEALSFIMGAEIWDATFIRDHLNLEKLVKKSLVPNGYNRANENVATFHREDKGVLTIFLEKGVLTQEFLQENNVLGSLKTLAKEAQREDVRSETLDAIKIMAAKGFLREGDLDNEFVLFVRGVLLTSKSPDVLWSAAKLLSALFSAGFLSPSFFQESEIPQKWMRGLHSYHSPEYPEPELGDSMCLAIMSALDLFMNAGIFSGEDIKGELEELFSPVRRRLDSVAQSVLSRSRKRQSGFISITDQEKSMIRVLFESHSLSQLYPFIYRKDIEPEFRLEIIHALAERGVLDEGYGVISLESLPQLTEIHRKLGRIVPPLILLEKISSGEITLDEFLKAKKEVTRLKKLKDYRSLIRRLSPNKDLMLAYYCLCQAPFFYQGTRPLSYERFKEIIQKGVESLQQEDPSVVTETLKRGFLKAGLGKKEAREVVHSLLRGRAPLPIVGSHFIYLVPDDQNNEELKKAILSQIKNVLFSLPILMYAQADLSDHVPANSIKPSNDYVPKLLSQFVRLQSLGDGEDIQADRRFAGNEPIESAEFLVKEKPLAVTDSASLIPRPSSIGSPSSITVLQQGFGAILNSKTQHRQISEYCKGILFNQLKQLSASQLGLERDEDFERAFAHAARVLVRENVRVGDLKLALLKVVDAIKKNNAGKTGISKEGESETKSTMLHNFIVLAGAVRGLDIEGDDLEKIADFIMNGETKGIPKYIPHMEGFPEDVEKLYLDDFLSLLDSARSMLLDSNSPRSGPIDQLFRGGIQASVNPAPWGYGEGWVEIQPDGKVHLVNGVQRWMISLGEEMTASLRELYQKIQSLESQSKRPLRIHITGANLDDEFLAYLFESLLSWSGEQDSTILDLNLPDEPGSSRLAHVLGRLTLDRTNGQMEVACESLWAQTRDRYSKNAKTLVAHLFDIQVLVMDQDMARISVNENGTIWADTGALRQWIDHLRKEGREKVLKIAIPVFVLQTFKSRDKDKDLEKRIRVALGLDSRSGYKSPLNNIQILIIREGKEKFKPESYRKIIQAEIRKRFNRWAIPLLEIWFVSGSLVERLGPELHSLLAWRVEGKLDEAKLAVILDILSQNGVKINPDLKNLDPSAFDEMERQRRINLRPSKRLASSRALMDLAQRQM